MQTAQIPSRHPWFATFDTDPLSAVDAVLRGAAYVPPFQRATPAQKIEGLFGDLPADAKEWRQLDDAVRQWLSEARAHTDEAMVRSGGAASFIAEAGDALRLVWRLDLKASANWIRDNLIDLRGWAEPLVLDDVAYDMPKALLAAIAQLQTSREWLRLWLDECRRAATPHLYHRIDTALSGLARMPPSPNAIAGLNHEVLVGLAIWGSALPVEDFKAKPAFLRRWRTIKASFPRSGEEWRKEWRDLFEEPSFNHPTQWLKDEEPALRKPAAPRKEPILPHCSSVIDRFEDEFNAEGLTKPLWGRMRTLIRQTENYAEITGISHYLVRSCTRIAKIIQDDSPGHAATLSRLALTWNRHDGHAWSVRARSLEKLDRPDLAEAALWEALRNAPQHPSIYLQLAMLLADQERLTEAEDLLRSALAVDPLHAQSLNELARVLWRNDKAPEALALLEGHSDQVSYYSRGCLLLAEGQLDEAQGVVTQCRRSFAGDPRIDDLADRIARRAIAEQRERLRLPRSRAAARRSVAWDEPCLEVEEAEAEALKRVRSLTVADRRFRLDDTEARRHALETVDAALAADPADGYAHVVKALAVPSYRPVIADRLEPRFANDLPLHLAVTTSTTPAATWDRLLTRFPQDSGLILLTRLGQGGGDDDGRLADWMGSDTGDDAWTPFVRATLRRHLEGESLPPAISPSMLAHDAILRRVEVGWGLVGTPQASQ